MNKKGFTLIELLVVVAIIGLLATLSIVALNSARARSRDAKRVADIKQVQTALELYYNDFGSYPAANAVSFIAGNVGITSTTTGTTTVYMKLNPVAPTPSDGTCLTANTYTYSTVDALKTYTISYCLGAATGGIPAGQNTSTPAGIR